MAIAPLPASNTPRFFLDYTSMGIKHSAQFRTNGLPDNSLTFFSNLITAMRNLVRIDDAILEMRFAEQGSDVTFPVFQVNLAGLASNASAIADDAESVFISTPFRGRPSGRKGRYDFFFPINGIPLDADNRFPFGSATALSGFEDALQALVDVGSGGVQLCDISASRILLNGYWNRAKSAYWQRRQRLG